MKHRPSTRCLLAAASFFGLNAEAATFSVTTTNDAGAGSLRAAITAANIDSAADTIEFDISSGGKTISLASALPEITESVTIDGTTQAGYSNSPIIELNGQGAGSGVDGLRVLADNCVIRGLVINRFNSDGIEINGGISNLVEGCYIGLDPGGTLDRGNTRAGILITNSASGNVIGGTGAGAGNVISGNAFNSIWISGTGSSSNRVVGNIIGLRGDGLTSGISSGQNGVFLDNAPGNVIGGGTASARNVISFISGEGIEVSGGDASGNIIQGNYIGTDLTGTLDFGNSGDGIFINSAPNTQIGGSTAGQGNLISGNTSEGITVSGTAATNNIIQGNWIGTDVTGFVPLGNSSFGIQFTSNPTNNLVGGTTAGQGNIIAFNGNDGVLVNNGSRNAIRANSIFSNGDAANEIGIDLGTVNGVTSNDNNDPDGGANLQQNYPVLTAATNHGSSVTIAGSLNSTASTQFSLDFFANTLFDPSGNGQGEIYLGSTNLTTAADGNVNFTVNFPVGLTGRYVSATATDPNGNTSEFSRVVTAQSTVTTNTFTVSNTNDAGPGSLRQAILDANASITDGADLIAFAIPGPGPHTNSLLTALPPVSDAVIIDGYTQSGASPNTLAVGNNAVLQIRLDGNNAPNNVPGLVLWAGNSVVRGLCITRFKSGSGFGIEVNSGDNVIEGNFIGVGLDGSTDLGNASDGVRITAGSNNLIGGVTPASRNLISGNSGDGVEINGVAASGNVIQGNYVGTDRNGGRGTADLGNSVGVNINNAPGMVVGGSAAGAGNVISDNASTGISISGANGTNNLVLGNLIGVDVSGAALGNNSTGVSISSSLNTIGGPGAGEGNTIAYSNGDGVSVSSGTGNSIRGNSIYENGGNSTFNLGIDLGSNGLLANDAGDGDSGANLQQNYPVLTNAIANPASTEIQGTLNSQASTTYQLDFYSSLAGDPSGNGEGQKWLGSASVNTDGSGNAAIDATVSGVAFGRFITVTATDPSGNTSEFAAWIRAGSTITPATFTVTNTNDSGPGSLRQAITDANAYVSSGNDLIAFAIPGAGPHEIAPLSAMTPLTDPATIDGYTQSGAQTNNLADGNNAVIQIQLSGINAPNNVDGLRLEADGCVVRGLAIVGFKGASGDGIEVVSANNIIEGNFIGLQTDGTNTAANAGNGILISSAGNTVGGSTTGARNVIASNSGDGVEINGVGASNNIIAGNFIGTDASGTLDKGNNADGLFVNGAPGNVIGGDTAASRNVISGNQSEGVTLQNTTATNNQVLNNYIGTDVTGLLALGNNTHGVQITSGVPSGNQIGSPNPGGNVIAFNGQDGVFVAAGTNNSIRANSIHNNGGTTVNNLGIDLGNNGVLANDSPDAATGVNLQQNYPELTGATANPATTQIQGTLRSRANTIFQLDFFSSLAGDPSGNGEGEKWLGSTEVTTDANGSNVFNVTVSGVVNGRFITATATDPFGNTSEFSPWIRAGSTIAPKTFTVINTNDSGAGSLREAILLSNLEVSSTNNLIHFNITTPEPHVISLLSSLPVPTEAVTIDGYTQTGASANTLTNGNNAVLKIRLDGNSAPFGTDGLRLTAIGGNIVRGLSITRFGDAIELGTNGSNRIEGNFLGAEMDGVTAAPNFSFGVHANNSPGNVIGGTTPAARNVISGNNTHGVHLAGAGAVNNRVEGNFIGTDFSGTLDLGNGQRGVSIEGASTNLVGGTNAAARNIISGNNGEGIRISGISQANVLQGNFIGTDVTGTAAVGNNFGGVAVALSTFTAVEGNVIGGTNVGAGNLIALNFGVGVFVQSGTNNAIRANNIFSNSSLGIDLTFDGNVTPNDPGDPDTGPNQIQNFPTLSAATITPANTTIQGSLNSRPGTSYAIDFFANVAPDPIFPNGEGQQYLGSASVATGADSNANFNVVLPVVALGRHITATATDPFGNTSEFSPAFAAVSTFAPVTFVVTNTLNSGPGSLHQTILNNNATPSSTNNVITFNIPGPGPHTIAPTSALPVIVEAVTIDGFSQPGSSSNSLASGNNAVWMIRLSGTNAGSGVRGFGFASSSNIVRGLVINGFRNHAIDLNTPGNVIIGNLIGLESNSSILANQGYGVQATSAGNRIGGAAPSDRNVISGNVFDGIFLSGAGATNNRVEGNFIGTDISGTLDRGNLGRGILVSAGSSNRIGGAVSGAGNVISGNSFDGISLSQANGTMVQGNFIGTDVTGMANLANTQGGIIVQNSTNVLIGGTTAAARNLISGNPSRGVNLGFRTENARVIGNYIGTDVTGTQPLPNTSGVIVESSSNTIGGVAAGEANVIAFNFSVGIHISSGTNNAIRANSIFANNQLGIDLGLFFGVTSNDVADVDAGPNNFQNFPILTNAVANVGNTVAQGALNSRPNTTYQLDFFSNDAADPSGHGEGQRFLGTTNVTTDGAGNANFSFSGAALISGRFITATATDPNGNTSEFSPWFKASSTIPSATFTVINTNDSGAGSLRQAMLDVDALPNAGNDLIQFAIPGSGVRTIAPVTPLPIPQDPITIDGFTQSGSSSNTLVEGNNAVLLIRLDGTNVQFGAHGLDLTNGNNVVRGLEVFRFPGHGVKLNEGSNNLVAGCLIWSNGFEGIELAGAGNRVGSSSPGDRNVISANDGYGVEIQTATASNNVVQGNFIGTDFAGVSALGNGLGGILVDSASLNLIGNAPGVGGIAPAGFTPAMRNVISGNDGPAIRIEGFGLTAPDGNRILGNFIGTDVTGTFGVTNLAGGLFLAGANNTTIGGSNESDANLIAFNIADAVRISSGTNNNIQGNSMFANTDLGIDLGFGGILLNDPGDPDTGANQFQNFPVLTNALLTSSNLLVEGTLNSAPNTSYRVDFYANLECDPNGNGEGRRWLGSITVMTGADSNAVVNASFPPTTEGRFITATATDSFGNTSEFCACAEVRSGLPPLDLAVINTNDSGPGSLRQAILDSNAGFTSSNNLIRFQISGSGVQTIAPLSQLPTITQPVVIDGFTQPGAMADTPDDGTNTTVWLIRLDGSSAGPGPVDGLHLTSSSNLIRGLVIVNFSDDGIQLETGSGSVISDCLLGIDVDSTGFPPPAPQPIPLRLGVGGGDDIQPAGQAGSGGNKSDINLVSSSNNKINSRTHTGNSSGDSICIDENSRDSTFRGGIGHKPSKKHSKKKGSYKIRKSKEAPIAGRGIKNGGPGTQVTGTFGPTGGPKIQTDPEFFYTNPIKPSHVIEDGQPFHQRGDGTLPNTPPLASATITEAVSQNDSTIINGFIPGFPGVPIDVYFYYITPGDDNWFREGVELVTPGSSGTGTVHHVAARLPEGSLIKTFAFNPLAGSSQDGAPATVQNSSYLDSDLAVAKRSAPNPVVVGSNLVYTITVTNLGPNTATNVSVLDTLPFGSIVVRTNSTHGSGFATGNIRGFNMITLTNGEVVTIEIEVTITNSVTLTNYVEVTGAVDDANFANNSDTNVTQVVTSPPTNPVLKLNTGITTVPEGTAAAVTGTRTGEINQAVQADVFFAPGSAKPDRDYFAEGFYPVNLAPGQTTFNVTIPTVANATPEVDKDLLAVLVPRTPGAVVDAPNFTRIIIPNDDGSPVNDLRFTSVTTVMGNPAFEWSGLPGQDHLYCSPALGDPFMPMPGSASPYVVTPLGAGTPDVFGYDDLLNQGLTTGQPGEFFWLTDTTPTGTIGGTVQNGGGPVIIRIGDSHQVTATDPNGNFMIQNVPAGEVPISFEQYVVITDITSGEKDYLWLRIVDFETLTPGGQVNINAKVELPKVIPIPPCNCVPWCGIVGGSFNGVQKVVAGGGKRGDCTDSVTVVVTGPGGVNDTLTGKRKKYSPAANGTWTVTATVCGETKKCEITLP